MQPIIVGWVWTRVEVIKERIVSLLMKRASLRHVDTDDWSPIIRAAGSQISDLLRMTNSAAKRIRTFINVVNSRGRAKVFPPAPLRSIPFHLCAIFGALWLARHRLGVYKVHFLVPNSTTGVV